VVTDAEGAVTRYSYDGLDRLISIQYPDSSVQYAYDAGGQCLTNAGERAYGRREQGTSEKRHKPDD
jgi:YD repeat-containing protein